jgi:drug/metabolite transporter (DMT)-like permease
LTPNLRGSLFMVASMGGFALEDALIKHAATGMPVGLIMGFIGLFGMAAFALQATLQGAAPLPRSLISRVMIIRSGFEIFGRVFYALAITLTPLTSASAILQATPLLVVLGAALIFGEKVGLRRWALITLGLVGVMLIIRPAAGDFTPLSLLAVAGMIGFAGRDLATRAAKPSLTNAQLGASGFLMLAVAGAVVTGFANAPIALPPTSALPALLGAALFATLGYGALTVAMRAGDVSVVTPFRYSRLIFALILGVAVFGERPDTLTLVGAAMIVACGVALMRR